MDVDYLNLYKASFLNMPLGLFIIDKDKHILSWNDWLSSKTKYSADDVIGKRLNSLFQEVDHQRFDWAVEQTLSYKSPQFLSQILNSYLIPIEIEDDTYDAIEYMQQDIEILPLQNLEDNFALVIIKDVTSEVHQKNVLMKMGYKLEEESLRDSS